MLYNGTRGGVCMYDAWITLIISDNCKMLRIIVDVEQQHVICLDIDYGHDFQRATERGIECLRIRTMGIVGAIECNQRNTTFAYDIQFCGNPHQ